MIDNKVDKATADDDFKRFTDAARIKMDRNRNTNDQKDLEGDRQRFIEEIMAGHIVVDDAGLVTVMTDNEHLPEVKFPRRVNARALAAADRRKPNEKWGQTIQQLSAVTGKSPGLIDGLDTCDFMNLLLVFGFFLES